MSARWSIVAAKHSNTPLQYLNRAGLDERREELVGRLGASLGDHVTGATHSGERELGEGDRKKG